MAPPPPPPPRQQQGSQENGRKKAYKGQVDVHRARRRRETQLIQLRKTRREETISKKRRDEASPSTEPGPATPDSDPPSSSDLPSLPGSGDADSQKFHATVKGLWSENPSLQLEATIHLRKLLSVDGNCPIEEIIRAGAVPRVVKLLSNHKLPKLQLEAAWVLTNITASSSDHTEIVIKSGAVPQFIELLGSPHNNVKEQVMWALGNIAADSERCREIIIENEGLVKLLNQFNEHVKISNLRIATWTLSNLCFGKMPSKSQIKDTLKILGQLLNSIDEKIVSDACWAVYYLCNNEIELFINSGLCPQLVKLLMHSSIKIINPVSLAIASISAGDDSQIQCLIEIGVIPCLFQILSQNYESSIKKQALMTTSNICAVTSSHIQKVIDANVIGQIIQISQNGEAYLKKEALWAISNAACNSSPDQIRYLVGQGCIKPLCDTLVLRQPDLLHACLNGLERILDIGEMEREKSGSNSNPYAKLVEECEGLEKLENLQEFDNDVIYDKTIELLEGYWNEEEEEEGSEGEIQENETPSSDDS